MTIIWKKSIDKRQHGFSLVELMVALLIGLLVLGGIMAIFANTRSTYQSDTGLARMQENARFAVNIMSMEIRKASYMGCLRDTSALDSTLNTTAGFATSYQIGVQGFDANSSAPGDSINLASVTAGFSPALSTAIPAIPGEANAVQGSDIVAIRRVDDQSARLVPPYNSGAQLFIEPGFTFNIGDILIVTDCTQATAFQLTSTNADGDNLSHSAKATFNPGNNCPTWNGVGGCSNQQYGDGSEIAKAITTIFYLRQDPTDALPALYMASSSNGGLGTGIKLVDGIESMQILYGVDETPTATSTGGTPTAFDRAERYMTATEVNNANLWNNVVTVRISLLMRTVNEPGEQADQSVDVKTYTLAGTQVTPVADKNRRRVFTTTIQIRNRIRGSG